MTKAEFFRDIVKAYEEYDEQKWDTIRYGSVEVQKQKAKDAIFTVVDNYFGGKK